MEKYEDKKTKKKLTSVGIKKENVKKKEWNENKRETIPVRGKEMKQGRKGTKCKEMDYFRIQPLYDMKQQFRNGFKLSAPGTSACGNLHSSCNITILWRWCGDDRCESSHCVQPGHFEATWAARCVPSIAVITSHTGCDWLAFFVIAECRVGIRPWPSKSCDDHRLVGSDVLHVPPKPTKVRGISTRKTIGTTMETDAWLS
jgi:hypothetical protein